MIRKMGGERSKSIDERTGGGNGFGVCGLNIGWACRYIHGQFANESTYSYSLHGFGEDEAANGQ
jgi:hypothetical protein